MMDFVVIIKDDNVQIKFNKPKITYVYSIGIVTSVVSIIIIEILPLYKIIN